MRSLLLAAILATSASMAEAAINLEWRPFEKIARPGEVVDIGLYAVSDSGSNQTISAMDVLLEWDASTLQLVGLVNNGPYTWFQSGFLPDSGLDGLNNTYADGNAKYTALAQFGNPAIATPGGLLITTIRFNALAETALNQIDIPAMLGQSSQTAVYGTAFPGQDVTGVTGDAVVMICQGASDADINIDATGNALDIPDFVTAILESSVEYNDVCHADFSGNKVVDVNDITGFVNRLLSS